MSGDDRVPTTGRRLDEVLRSDPPTAAEAVRVAARVADEVATLHAAGRAHGSLGAGAVLVADDGSVLLTGGSPDRGRPAAPAEARTADVRAVGRILAAGLGVAADEPLPASVEDLVQHALAADAPACALAGGLHRLEHDRAGAALLLPPPAPVPAARDAAGADGMLASLIPRAERRVTGVAAAVVGAATALGLALLVGGAPASSTQPPLAAPSGAPAAAAQPAEEVPLSPGVSAAASDDRVPATEVLTSGARPVLALHRSAARPVLAPAAPAPALEAEAEQPAAQPSTPTQPTAPTQPGAPATGTPEPSASPDPRPQPSETTPPSSTPPAPPSTTPPVVPRPTSAPSSAPAAPAVEASSTPPSASAPASTTPSATATAPTAAATTALAAAAG